MRTSRKTRSSRGMSNKSRSNQRKPTQRTPMKRSARKTYRINNQGALWQKMTSTKSFLGESHVVKIMKNFQAHWLRLGVWDKGEDVHSEDPHKDNVQQEDGQQVGVEPEETHEEKSKANRLEQQPRCTLIEDDIDNELPGSKPCHPDSEELFRLIGYIQEFGTRPPNPCPCLTWEDYVNTYLPTLWQHQKFMERELPFQMLRSREDNVYIPIVLTLYIHSILLRLLLSALRLKGLQNQEERGCCQLNVYVKPKIILSDVTCTHKK